MIIKLPAYALLEIGLLFTFAFMWAMDPLWRHTVGAALRRMAGIGWGGVKGFGASHPLHFLADVDAAVVSWIERGKQGSERGVVYMFNQIVDAAALYVAIPLAIALALYELANYVVHHAAKAVTRVEVHNITKPVAAAAKVAVAVTKTQFNHLTARVAHLEHRVARLAHASAGAIAAPFPRIGSLERKVASQSHRLSRLEKLLAGGLGVALLIRALSRLGLGWLRCSNVSKVGKSVCKMNPLALEALLLDAAALTVTFNLEEFAEELQTVTGEAARLIHNWSS